MIIDRSCCVEILMKVTLNRRMNDFNQILHTAFEHQSMTMSFSSVIYVFSVLSVINANVYVYYTEDGVAVENYDCIENKGQLFCIRPVEPIQLRRDEVKYKCYHNGTSHLFTSLLSRNVSIYTVLHKWRSSIEKVEQYARFLRLGIDHDGYLCQCHDRQTFGKMCEYRFVEGATLKAVMEKRNSLRKKNPWLVELHGDIVCYETLQCNSGILCLDWRDICDGFQQCMLGVDEENCDKLEFNECESDEYRCKNGMCIPDEYFLDSVVDCMDFSDEREYTDYYFCNFNDPHHSCDDRVCPLLTFSCGIGHCINDRFAFQKISDSPKHICHNRREQYHICETQTVRRTWTLPNGRCYGLNDYAMVRDETTPNLCIYYLKCALSKGLENNCPCRKPTDCAILLQEVCPSSLVQYPQGGYPVAYISYYYNISDSLTLTTPSLIVFNGTIKCRGYLIDFYLERVYEPELDHPNLETWLCRHLLLTNQTTRNERYEEYCNHELRTFNNRSYNFVEICGDWRACFSAYRVANGFLDCVDEEDENRAIFQTKFCENVKRHRFQCSTTEKTCLLAAAIGDNWDDCDNKYDEWWLGTSKALSHFSCSYDFIDSCTFVRQYLEDSWRREEQGALKQQTQISFRAYCDTFWSLHSKIDEDLSMCKLWWQCPSYQWQCRTGQCMQPNWVLDNEWDCADASDEEALFMANTTIPKRNLYLRQSSDLRSNFRRLYRYQLFDEVCNTSIEYPCLPVSVTNSLINISYQRPCIDFSKIGDGRIDCMGASDERNTIEHCDSLSMLGYAYQCSSTRACIPYEAHCQTRCPNLSDDALWCDRQYHQSSCSNTTNFMCFNGSCTKKKHCEQMPLCTYCEDKYMCLPKEFTRYQYYRDDKIPDDTIEQIFLELPSFPNTIIIEERRIGHDHVSSRFTIHHRISM